MSTLSSDPDSHPQRRAALAAHALREALAALGLLDQVPECTGTVIDGRPVVHLGEIEEAAALALATQLSRTTRNSTRRRRNDEHTEDGGPL